MQQARPNRPAKAAGTNPTPPALGLRRAQSLTFLEQLEIAKAKSAKPTTVAKPSSAGQRIEPGYDSPKSCTPNQPACCTPALQHNSPPATSTPPIAVAAQTSIATPEFGVSQDQASGGHAADHDRTLSWLHDVAVTKADVERLILQALKPVLGRLDAVEASNLGLRRALDATMKRATDSEAACKCLEEKLHSVGATCNEARERSVTALDKAAAAEAMTAQELQQLKEVANALQSRCEEADRACLEATAARADLKAAEVGFGEAVQDFQGAINGVKGHLRDQLARLADKGETDAAAARAAMAAGTAASAHTRVQQVEAALQDMQRKMHELEMTVIAVEQSVYEPQRPSTPSPSTAGRTSAPIPSPISALKGLFANRESQHQDFQHLQRHVVGLAVKVTEMESALRGSHLVRAVSDGPDHRAATEERTGCPSDQQEIQLEAAAGRQRRVPSEGSTIEPGAAERLLQLEKDSKETSKRVTAIEAELTKVIEVANLQEVVATQLVREAHATQQANRGRNMVVFDPPQLPEHYKQLTAEQKQKVRKDQAVALCTKVQCAYERVVKKSSFDETAIEGYYQRAIVGTNEFFTRPSKTALSASTQRNIVIEFASQQAKIGFLGLNGVMLKEEIQADKRGQAHQQGSAAGQRSKPNSTAKVALKATHDLTMAERTAKQALTSYMMELRGSGKRTAVGAHRGQAVMFVFHTGAGKPRDVYVWDADKEKPACMIRGMGEDEWKQYVRAEKPFPLHPCSYLGLEGRPCPRSHRGFGHDNERKPTKRVKARPGDDQGSQRERGSGTVLQWVRKNQGRSGGTERERAAVERMGGGRAPSRP